MELRKVLRQGMPLNTEILTDKGTTPVEELKLQKLVQSDCATRVELAKYILRVKNAVALFNQLIADGYRVLYVDFEHQEIKLQKGDGPDAEAFYIE